MISVSKDKRKEKPRKTGPFGLLWVDLSLHDVQTAFSDFLSNGGTATEDLMLVKLKAISNSYLPSD